MFKPSPQLQARMRFTTKQVAGGFYRGTRSGAMGSHTEYGGYLIDWRKTRHYNVPDLNGFKLTPYIGLNIQKTARVRELRGRNFALEIPPKVGDMEFLRQWKKDNPFEYDDKIAEEAEQYKAYYGEPQATQDAEAPEETEAAQAANATTKETNVREPRYP